MAATQSLVNSSFTDVMSYDCTVRISYTVTIFSYSGCYYDDNAATTYFTSKGYNQNGFMTQFKDAHNISLAGAKLERHGKGNQAFISAILPIYTMRKIALTNPEDGNQKLKEGAIARKKCGGLFC